MAVIKKYLPTENKSTLSQLGATLGGNSKLALSENIDITGLISFTSIDTTPGRPGFIFDD